MNATSRPIIDTALFGTYAPNAAQRMVLAIAHGSDLKRGAFRPTLSVLIGRLGSGPIDTSYQGASFRLYHRSSATERGALLDPDYNLPELDFLRAYTPAGGVFVDVGANAGTYALPLARHAGDDARVIAIEPHPVACARLAFNARASRLGNVTIVASAAGDIDGELTIETDGNDLGSSHISKNSGIRGRAHRLVTILKMNDIAHIDALKIGVEGYEDRVLAPFFKHAPHSLWPRAVAIAHLKRNAWQANCIDEMIAQGYGVAGKTRGNTLLVKR